MMADNEDWPITGVVVVADISKCPAGYSAIDRTYDRDEEANLWRDGFFGRRVTRYLCIQRAAPRPGKNVLVDVVIKNDKDPLLPGFTVLDYTTDTREKANKKKMICVRWKNVNLTNSALSEIIILRKGAKLIPDGYKVVGELNNLMLYYKMAKIKPHSSLRNQNSDPTSNNSNMDTPALTSRLTNLENLGNASSAFVVVAIDFGTTYTGWAFSFKSDYTRDPLKISSKNWQGSSLVSQKAPTCILIKPDGKTTDSFGYEAESKYAEMAEEKVEDKWFFFRRFKMMLFKDKGLERDALIEDATGKKLLALTVFSRSIEYLKKDVLETISQQIVDEIDVRDIHWILTVPAIWNDGAKQFMREAAHNTEIPDENLTICLEPEAASIYCRHLPVSKSSGTEEKTSLSQFSAGTKYLVLDAGGGTVDITVHEVTVDGHLKECHKATGGAWGGTKVDDVYESFLTGIVGEDIMAEFKKKHMDDYIEVFRDFELKKRQISSTKQEKTTFRVPVSLSDLCKEMNGKCLKQLLIETKYGQKVNVVNEKVRIEADVVRGFFQPAVDSIIDHVVSLLRQPSVEECAAILMVGGFSASPMLQESVKENFPRLNVIVPDDVGLAVLKGAVIFGHEPTAIKERVCKYTYGTDSTHDCDESCEHPEGWIESDINGRLLCCDIFDVHAEIGQSIKVDEELEEQIYCPVSDDQTSIGFEIYASSSNMPFFVTDEGCTQIGEFYIPILDTSLGKDREFGVSFIFGGTEIRVKVTDKAIGKVTYHSANFLG